MNTYYHILNLFYVRIIEMASKASFQSNTQTFKTIIGIKHQGKNSICFISSQTFHHKMQNPKSLIWQKQFLI